MDADVSNSEPRWPRRFATALSVYALLGGAISLSGWAFAIPSFTDWGGIGITIKPNAALALLVCSIGTLVLAWRPQSAVALRALGGFVALVGGLTLFEHLSGQNLGIDTLVFDEPDGAPATASPGRMGPPASFSLMSLGVALVLAGTRSVAPSLGRFVPLLGVTVCALMMLSFTGYLFNANRFYAVPWLSGIALQTSTMLLALGLALVTAVPQYEPMRLLVSDSGAGMLARRVLPLLVALPPLLGWLRTRGQAIGWFDEGTGRSLLVLSITFLSVGMMWRALRSLARQERSTRVQSQRLHEILGSVTDAFYSLDSSWRFTFVNEETVRRFGMPRQQILGSQIWQLFPAAVGTEVYLQFHQAMRDRVAVEFEAYYEPWKRWFAGRAFPTFDGGLAVYSHDVTQHKRAEEALKASDRRKDEFLATLAHELRNPLAPIRNSLSILHVASSDRAAIERAVAMMGRQMTQLVRLIDDLLDISRIRLGRLELRKERIELALLIRQAVESCRPLASAAGHEVTVMLPPEPIYLDADGVRLSQVVTNLLNNACKFTDRGGRIRLFAERQGSEVVVSVKDDGIGIAPDKLRDIFEMFSQIDRSLERSQGGLGIGLALVKRLVELHGGSIEAYSEGVGHGSEFIVRLPAALDRPPPTKGEANGDIKVVSGRRVLVVDDNRDGAESLAMLLRLAGGEIRVAHDGEEGVAAATQFSPDVVLLDIGLPKLNGYDACRRIRQDASTNNAVVVALTGWGQEEDRRKSADAGFDGHLVKPVDHSALGDLLTSLLKERSAQRRRV